MPGKKKSAGEVFGELAWVNNLPESVWSRGLLDTALNVKTELEGIEAEKAALAEKEGRLYKMLRGFPARAEREAPLVYGEEAVAQARR